MRYSEAHKRVRSVYGERNALIMSLFDSFAGCGTRAIHSPEVATHVT